MLPSDLHVDHDDPPDVASMIRLSRLVHVIALAMALVTLPLFAVEPSVRILPLGDSLTYGEALTAAQGGYRNKLYELLDNAGYELDFLGTLEDTNNPSLPDKDHEGHQGFRIDQIQANLGTWLDSVEDPDVVLLLIGTNDVWQDYQLASAPARLNALIGDIVRRRPFAKIVVSSLPPRYDIPAYEAKQVTFNNAIPGIVSQQVALGHQVTYLDMHSLPSPYTLTPFDYSSDGVHLSASGYVKMANGWAPKVTAVISPAGTGNPPVIARTEAPDDLTHISVVFSKPVADDAASLANFSLSGGLTVSGATLDAATKRTITLTTSPQTPGTIYSLSVSGVRDRTPQQTLIAPDSMVNFTAVPIINGSFENDFAGWTLTNPGNMEIQDGSPYQPTDGGKLLSFNSNQSAAIGEISQSFPTTVGQAYSLTFDVGRMTFFNNSQKIGVYVTGSGLLLDEEITISGPTGSPNLWKPQSFTFVADSASTTLYFEDQSSTTDSVDLILDDVRVVPLATYNLSVTSTSTSGANMTITPLDRNGAGNGVSGLIRSYQQGAVVTVTAAATHAGGSFQTWRKNGVDLPGSISQLQVTMDGNHSLTAVYESNQSPVATADAYSTDEDLPLVVPADGVLGNDSDDGPSLTAVLTADVQHGDLTLHSDGGFSYVPDQDFNGQDSFSYKANDGNLDSNIVTVAITVDPVNDMPVANSQSREVDEDGMVEITLSGSDVDEDPLTCAVASGPSHGDLVLNGAVATYTPDPDYNGPDEFTFVVNDGEVDSIPATVSITVNPLEEFNQWLAGYSLAAGPGDDSDGDQISNLMEYLLGGNPANQPDTGLLPTAELLTADLDGEPGTEDYLEFSYRCTDLANLDPSVSIKVEWATDLAGPWSDAGATAGVNFDEEAAGVGVKTIKVALPRTMEVDGHLFARLNVVIDLPPVE